MKFYDSTQEAYTALIANKVRSGLTVLGIVIGIGSVIAMVSIGQGAKASVTEQFASLGSNMLVVSPGSQGGMRAMVSGGRGSATTLTDADATALEEEVTNAVGVAPVTSSRSQVVVSGANTNTSITGTTPAYASVRALTVEEGTFLSDRQERTRAKVAVLGPTTRDDLFGEGASVVGETIRIDGTKFTIIGVTESKGSSGMTNQDDVVYIPLSTAKQYLTGSNTLSSIYVQAPDEESMDAMQTEITTILMRTHHITDEASKDFTVTNQADILDAVSSVSETLTLLLGAIAGISLVVGGIGIMNMMLTTVTERTREIGLRKAIGARSGDISLQFLLESMMLTVFGGVVGVLAGWGASYAISTFASMTTKVTLSSVLLAFGVSALIGVVFGYYPARKAARLNPIEALRYE